MKVGVLIFPGSNCDKDTIWAFQNMFGQEVVELWHKDTDLQGVDLVNFGLLMKVVKPLSFVPTSQAFPLLLGPFLCPFFVFLHHILQ